MVKDIITIAGAINTLYDKIYASYFDENDMTEMKLHKLLYFAQKKHYQNFGKWLFREDFEGWVHGPVNRDVRRSFNKLPTINYSDLTLDEEYTIRETLHEYGRYSAWHLRELSHMEPAYKKSRIFLKEDEPGNELIPKDDLIEDISYEKDIEEIMEV